MAIPISDAELKNLLNAIPVEQKPIFENVLSTIALQAEVIDDLLWKLEIEYGSDAMKKKVMGPVLTRLAAKLDNPVVQGPTLEEISGAINEMHKTIESAAEAQNIFQALLGFALKIAPLAL